MEDVGSSPIVGAISADVMQILVDISFSESEFLRVRVPSSAPNSKVLQTSKYPLRL